MDLSYAQPIVSIFLEILHEMHSRLKKNIILIDVMKPKFRKSIRKLVGRMPKSEIVKSFLCYFFSFHIRLLPSTESTVHERKTKTLSTASLNSDVVLVQTLAIIFRDNLHNIFPLFCFKL